MPSAVRVIYALAIATFLALTVGFGTVAFFPDPEVRDELRQGPRAAVPAAPPGEAARAPAEDLARQETDQRAWEDYERSREARRRDILIGTTALGATILFAAVVRAGSGVLALGLFLGGWMVILWGLIYGGQEASKTTLFIASLVVLGLLVSASHPRLRGRLRGLLRAGDADLLGRGPTD